MSGESSKPRVVITDCDFPSTEIERRELAAVDAEVRTIVEEAYDFARNSPFPDPATATQYVYAGG